eukprot:8686114-Pyramimonas_sp.AAC.2
MHRPKGGGFGGKEWGDERIASRAAERGRSRGIMITWITAGNGLEQAGGGGSKGDEDTGREHMHHRCADQGPPARGAPDAGGMQIVGHGLRWRRRRGKRDADEEENEAVEDEYLE